MEGLYFTHTLADRIDNKWIAYTWFIILQLRFGSQNILATLKAMTMQMQIEKYPWNIYNMSWKFCFVNMSLKLWSFISIHYSWDYGLHKGLI